ncbi:MAG TPA: tetraacyldisaccharide 4'-kinase, partial [Pyrinomonadaceae bacterium]|nr:tetraacyldisaccharide 4'-kinase [Pyrinomonadaceae bacterium]
MNSSGSLIMMPLGVLYGAITRARLAAYRSGVFSVSQLPAPVISVGNITTGGTGKTPLVEWVCRVLSRDGKKVCVLTRGYGRANPETQVVVSDGTRVLVDERQAGDEPFLLAGKLVGIAAVIANGNRVAAGHWAIQNLGTNALVLDDGFQHLRIARNFDIVTIDATNPWGDGALLPHGRLREEPGGLARADCVVITRTEQIEDVSYLRTSIQKHTTAPIFTSRMVTAGIETIQGERVDQNTLTNASLAAFCAIGNPGSFFTHLERAGARVVFAQVYPDHHVYQQHEINRLV